MDKATATPRGGGQRVRLWEAVVLAVVVGGLSYAAGMRNGIQTERRRVERTVSAADSHEHVAEATEAVGATGADVPAMNRSELRERLAGFGLDELLSIGQQHLEQAQATADGSEVARRRFMIAAAAYERALQLKPNDPNVLMDLGLALQGLGEDSTARARLKEAVAGYEKALRDKPNDPDLLTDLGVAERALGNPEQAVKRFRAAAAADARHAQSRFNLGLVLLMDLGRTEEAIEAWEDYLHVTPKNDVLRKLVEDRLEALRRR